MEVTIIIRGYGTSETAAMVPLQLMEMRLAVKWECIRPLIAPFRFSFSVSTEFSWPCDLNSERYSFWVHTWPSLIYTWAGISFSANCILFQNKLLITKAAEVTKPAADMPRPSDLWYPYSKPEVLLLQRIIQQYSTCQIPRNRAQIPFSPTLSDICPASLSARCIALDRIALGWLG